VVAAAQRRGVVSLGPRAVALLVLATLFAVTTARLLAGVVLLGWPVLVLVHGVLLVKRRSGDAAAGAAAISSTAA
jgi:hypothetical protein